MKIMSGAVSRERLMQCIIGLNFREGTAKEARLRITDGQRISLNTASDTDAE